MRKRSEARLTIYGVGKMTKARRKQIAAWLRERADSIVKEGDEYTDKRFVGRFN